MFMDGSLNESVEDFRKITETNVVAQYAILKTVTEIMKTQKSGYIFNIASRAAKYGFPSGGIYGSTKFAFVGLTESLYRELPNWNTIPTEQSGQLPEMEPTW
jgi:short-subunit dehydrogenase